MNEAWRTALQAALRDSRVRWNAPLHKATTLRVGGPADALVELESERDLLALLRIVREYGVPLHLLGRGSNVLVRDEGLRGVVLRMGRAFRQVQLHPGAPRVVAGAGVPNAVFVERCRRGGLGGMEFLIAIPGTIGGAVAMNAGAHDGDTATFLEAVRCYCPDREIVDVPAERFSFGYRQSPLRANEGRLVLGATFGLQALDDAEMRRRRDRFLQWRHAHQPRDYPNCGSVFKNPPGQPAARLIDEAGLKGRMLGGAQVSEKHANFIVNRGTASAADILALVDLIRETVYSRSGISLELEMQVFPLPAQRAAGPVS